MSIAELIRAMAAAGATPEAIALAVEAIEAADARVEAGKAAARERKRRQRAKERDDHGTVTGQSRDIAVTVTDETLALSPNENNSNPHTHTPEGVTPRARKADPFPRPDYADPQHWADILAARKLKKLANTPTAHAKLLRDVARFADAEWPPGRIIEHAAEKGWAGIYDPRNSQDLRNDRSPRHRQDHRFRPGPRPVDGFTAALREAADRGP